MDPLSITASAIALCQATTAGISAIRTLRSLKQAPAEFQELQDELMFVRSFTQTVPQIVLLVLPLAVTPAAKECLRLVQDSIRKLEGRIKELDGVSESFKRKSKGLDANGRLKIPSIKWKLETEKITGILEGLRVDKRQLVDTLQLLQHPQCVDHATLITNIQQVTGSMYGDLQKGFGDSKFKLDAIQTDLDHVSRGVKLITDILATQPLVSHDSNPTPSSEESSTPATDGEDATGSPSDEDQVSSFEEPTDNFLPTILKALNILESFHVSHEADTFKPHPLSSDSSQNSNAEATAGVSTNTEMVLQNQCTSTSSSSSTANMKLYQHFDRLPSFFPEAYGTGRSRGRSMLWPMKENCRLQSLSKYYLIYAQTPRSWRRITLSIPIKDSQAIYDKLWPWNWLVDQELERFLDTTELYETVTNVHLRFLPPSGDQFDGIKFDLSRSFVTEDEDEAAGLPPSDIMTQVDDFGCRQIHESEIICQFHIQRFSYAVLFRGKPCVEKKLSFTWSSESYMQDLVALHILQGAKYVAQFVGVVLDENKNLEGFVCERAELGCIADLFRVANQRSAVIPWPIREQWARHIISALIDIHAKGLVVGKLQLTSVAVDKSYTAKLVRLDGEACHKVVGCLAPEILSQITHVSEVSRKHMTSRTDIYQLGLVLWLLAAQRPIHWVSSDGRFCGGHADHPTDMAILPPCDPEIPGYYQDIINICRAGKRERLSARRLLALFPKSTEVEGDFKPGIIQPSVPET